MSHNSVFETEHAPPSEDVLAFTGFAGPQEPSTPGFSLIDDCDGRFVIDAVTGFISVSGEAIVERERGQTHTARMRVVEGSGDSYEMLVRLVITGLVPQLVGEEGFGAFSIEDAPAPKQPDITPPAPGVEDAPVPASPQHTAPAVTEQALPFTQARWTSFAAFAAHAPQHRQRGRLAHAPYGALAHATPANLDCSDAVLTVPAPAFSYPA